MSDSDQLRKYTADIVTSYLKNNHLEPERLHDLIDVVYRTLSKVTSPQTPSLAKIPVIAIRRSITSDYIVCLDCGYRAKVLRRHLARVHGLTPDQYRARWELPPDYPIIAPAYSEHRSTMAKEMGLGRYGNRRRAIASNGDIP
jgi:predicted transcriptional regulator